MKDGAPPHIANPVKRLLSMHFGNYRIISRHFRRNWLPRSCYLILCDFWLWDFRKHVVFGGAIANLAELKTYCATHSQHQRRYTPIEHDISRFELVADNGGHHIEHFLSLSWWIGFQLRVPQLPNDLEIIVLFID
ncbi:hypothetical protein AVEN_272540-1 [Araneus ventricosus]|uniref:Uncharacterized protein n=1 Tax=Araneus ventricosus TaxID=182803 RepID=A0A4Y2E9F3_ARAVE|nr:hypothetical protein AVEN_272540-1 [Araneus ventricosus]